MLDSLEERLAWGADEDPPIVMAQALVLYLGHRLDEIDDDEEDLLRLAARAEFDGHPPERVVDLAQRARGGADVSSADTSHSRRRASPS